MKNFDKSVAEHRSELDNLYRSYKLNGLTDIEKIHNGFDLYGEQFILKVLAIITPKSHVEHFETVLESKLPTVDVAGLQTSTYTTQQLASAATANTSKGWTFWEKFLTAATDTGKAVGSILGNIKNPQSELTAEQKQQAMQLQATEASNSKMLYILGAAFLAVILIILVVKK